MLLAVKVVVIHALCLPPPPLPPKVPPLHQYARGTNTFHVAPRTEVEVMIVVEAQTEVHAWITEAGALARPDLVRAPVSLFVGAPAGHNPAPSEVVEQRRACRTVQPYLRIRPSVAVGRRARGKYWRGGGLLSGGDGGRYALGWSLVRYSTVWGAGGGLPSGKCWG